MRLNPSETGAAKFDIASFWRGNAIGAFIFRITNKLTGAPYDDISLYDNIVITFRKGSFLGSVIAEYDLADSVTISDGPNAEFRLEKVVLPINRDQFSTTGLDNFITVVYSVELYKTAGVGPVTVAYGKTNCFGDI